MYYEASMLADGILLFIAIKMDGSSHFGQHFHFTLRKRKYKVYKPYDVEKIHEVGHCRS